MSDRHQFRADWHDYNGGIYFVTICSAGKRHYFGEVTYNSVGMRFFASALGKIVEECIQKIPSYYNDVEIWNSVVMPNHIHLIIAIRPQTSTSILPPAYNIGCLKPKRHEAPPSQDWHHNSRLAKIIGAFKAGVTRRLRTRKIASLQKDIWQQRFHEHIINDQHAYDKIMNYIDTNVENWCRDTYNANPHDNNLTPVGTRLFASAPTDDKVDDPLPINNADILPINNADAKNRVPTNPQL